MKRNIALALVAAALIVGCAKGPTLAGTWTIKVPASMPPGSRMEAVISDPDKLVMTMDIEQAIPGGTPIKIHGEINGTFKLEGENMTMKADSVKFSGSGFPEIAKAQMEKQMVDMGDQVKKQINEEGVTKYKRVDEDTFTLTGKTGEPQEYKRKK